MRSFELRPDAFDRRADALRRQISNFERRQPVSLASYHRGISMETGRFTVDQVQSRADLGSISRDIGDISARASLGATHMCARPEQLAAAAKDVTFNDMATFRDGLLPRAAVEALVVGNVVEADAQAMPGNVDLGYSSRLFISAIHLGYSLRRAGDAIRAARGASYRAAAV